MQSIFKLPVSIIAVILLKIKTTAADKCSYPKNHGIVSWKITKQITYEKKKTTIYLTTTFCLFYF